MTSRIRTYSDVGGKGLLSRNNFKRNHKEGNPRYAISGYVQLQKMCTKKHYES